MAKTEMTKSPETTPSRPRDVISAMHDEMDRVFQRFQHGWPRWPMLYGRDGDITVPELDVRDNTNAVVVQAELPSVDEKDVSVTLANGMLTIKGEKKREKENEGREVPRSPNAASSVRSACPIQSTRATSRRSSTRAC